MSMNDAIPSYVHETETLSVVPHALADQMADVLAKLAEDRRSHRHMCMDGTHVANA